MSKLLTDLMEAERKRRQLVIGRGAGNAAAAADERSVADQAAAAGLPCALPEADASEPAATAAPPSRVAAEHGAPAETVSSRRGPEVTGWRSFVATALALMAGIGIGIWLGRPPAVSVRPWSEDQGVMRLRLDDRLMTPPPDKPHVVPRRRVP